MDPQLLRDRGFTEVKPGVWGKAEAPTPVRREAPKVGKPGAFARAGNERDAGALRTRVAKLEHGDAGACAGAPGVQSQSPARFSVRVVSWRARLIDDDNLCEKFVVDGLRYAGLLPDDCHGEARISTHQEKCEKAQERTEITLTRNF